MAYLRLIRGLNLFIMALTMYAMRWFVIYPILSSNGQNFRFSEFDFFLLVAATILIAAGGYVINDYFDRKADRINDPENVLIGTKVNRRFAIILHSVLNVVGVALGFYLSIKTGYWKYGFIFLLITFILWFYSTSYKRKFLLGNFVIAFITAMVPLMVFVFEYPFFYHPVGIDLEQKNLMFFILKIILGFSFFAFLMSMVREIVKDIEDIKGDMRLGCKSLPIVWGVKAAGAISVILIIITILSMFAAYYLFLREKIVFANNPYSLIYLGVLILLMLFALILLIRSKEKKNYYWVSFLIKVAMFVGVLYSLIIFIIYNSQAII